MPAEQFDVESALVVAKVLTAALLADGPTQHDLGQGPWAERAEVHQATGMVVAQLGVPESDALALLRAHAYSHDQSVSTTGACGRHPPADLLGDARERDRFHMTTTSVTDVLTRANAAMVGPHPDVTGALAQLLAGVLDVLSADAAAVLVTSDDSLEVLAATSHRAHRPRDLPDAAARGTLPRRAAHRHGASSSTARSAIVSGGRWPAR